LLKVSIISPNRKFEAFSTELRCSEHDVLQKASSYVQTIQERQGIKITCPEEIAYQQGFISFEQLERLKALAFVSEYGHYLQKLCMKSAFSL